jgi:hypothetical protein
MLQETAERLYGHHHQCGGLEFAKTTVQRDPGTGERYIAYRCLKCKTEVRESLLLIEPGAVSALQEKAA